jgi:hypothetical protein
LQPFHSSGILKALLSRVLLYPLEGNTSFFPILSGANLEDVT